MTRLEAKRREAIKWRERHPGAFLPRIMQSAIRGAPLPPEPIQFN